MEPTKKVPPAASTAIQTHFSSPLRCSRKRRRRDSTAISSLRCPSASLPAPSFSDLPFDVLARLAAAFNLPNLWAASAVCRSWREALRPLREAMVLLRWGKRFKHGRGPGISRPNPTRALEHFLKGATRGSAAAMVDAGLMYWEMGRKEEAKALYEKAAQLGSPAGQCNLGICYLEADEPMLEEAVKWFCRAANSGYVRAQYNVALCFQKGRGVKCDIQNAAIWYLRAAEGGNVRAMYNTSLCYSLGEGLPHDVKLARMWMKRAADSGHCKAQYEHGLQLISSGDLIKALVYLELASRAGESDALQVRDRVSQSLSHTSRVRVLLSVDKWQPLRLSRTS